MSDSPLDSSTNKKPKSLDQINYPIYPIPQAILKEIPNNQLSWIPKKQQIYQKKYSTSIDKRNFLTVYEFLVNNHWIIWDYVTGYVHLTGLWKAIGNSKADIVKLVENAPELVNSIKRIRGGYLKIQGTWLPFKYAKVLAIKFCFNIRYCLIPIFGENFPNECLKPTDYGFGELKLFLNSDKKTIKKKIKRRSSSISKLENNSSLDNNFLGTIKDNSKKPAPKVSNSNTTLGYQIPNSTGDVEYMIKDQKFHSTREPQERKYSFNGDERVAKNDTGEYLYSYDQSDTNSKSLNCISKSELIDMLNASKSLQLLRNNHFSNYNVSPMNYNYGTDSSNGSISQAHSHSNSSSSITYDPNVETLYTTSDAKIPNQGSRSSFDLNPAMNYNKSNVFNSGKSNSSWENAVESDEETLINSSINSESPNNNSHLNQNHSPSSQRHSSVFSSNSSCHSHSRSLNITRKNSLNNLLNFDGFSEKIKDVSVEGFGVKNSYLYAPIVPMESIVGSATDGNGDHLISGTTSLNHDGDPVMKGKMDINQLLS